MTEKLAQRFAAPLRMIALVACLGLTACASSQGPETGINDPLEPVNRVVHPFNQAADQLVIRPAAETYRFVVPEFFRDATHNFLNNLRTPMSAANQLLQGDLDGTVSELQRFFINSTIGFAGISDEATKLGIEAEREDFGQTLAIWGVPEIAYLELPLIGPSSVRDAAGSVVDMFIDPLSAWALTQGEGEIMMARTIMEGLDARERSIETIDSLREQSPDLYATFRSVYHQRRQSLIADGEATLEDIDYID